MTTIIIIHGTGGSPEGNWFPWLKRELERTGCSVFAPQFPPPEEQNITSWLSAFKPYEKALGKETILIGHSIGPAFLLNVLERTDVNVRAAFFVAGFTGALHNDFDQYNKTFAEREFDWERIKEHCGKFYIINSDNDPYVPLAKGRNLAEHLGAELIILHDAGHINAEFGYMELPMLLELVKREI